MRVLNDPDRLLRDAQAGNPDWSAIYRIVRRPMYLAVWRCLRSCRCYGGLSDDDVVARAFDDLTKGLEGVHSLVGTARVIAYRRAIDLVRQRHPEEPCDGLDDMQDDDELAIELERREVMLNRAIGLLDRLTDRQRVAVVETVMKGRSCAAVAGQLNVSPQAVSKLKGKALDHLLVWLVEEQGSGEESWEAR